MSEVIGAIAATKKKNVTALKSKAHVSIETTASKENVKETRASEALKKIEIKMDDAEHAFALVSEIRAQIEAAYRELLPPTER